MIKPAKRLARLPIEIAFVAFALLLLLAAQLMLSGVIHGSTYRGPDGGMIQANIYTALKFGGIFNVTNLNPLQGLGSQLLPKNAWANPAFWPFALFTRETAADVSSAVALGIYALCCYVMARCFDVPVLPSAIAAQLCIVLFSPALFILDTPRNFSPTPPDAVTYAPYMVALGLLVRLQGESWRQFILVTIGIATCLLYSIYCDPAFTMIAAVGWAVAFATITFFPFRPRSVAIRGAALASCFGSLIVSGPAVYLYTLSMYSSRGQYPQIVDRVRTIDQASALSFSYQMHKYYIIFAVGLLAGLFFARVRTRALVLAGVLSACFCFVYVVIYILLLDAPWLLPMPLYIEQCLFVLFMTGAVAGFSAVLQSVWSVGRRYGLLTLLSFMRPRLSKRTAAALAVAAIFIIPTSIARFAIRDAAKLADVYYWPWAEEPEVIQFFTDRIALTLGAPFRGSVNFLSGMPEDGMIDDMWSHGVPTATEYSQTANAPSLYFTHKLLKKDVRRALNSFDFTWRNGLYSATYWTASQLLGVRYVAERGPLPEGFLPGLSMTKLPYHVPKQRGTDERPGFWYIYELPHPNLGNYSPTEVKTAASGDEIMAALSQPGFDFTKHAMLTTSIQEPLVVARDLRMSLIRDGLHLTGHSDATSLVVLPQQFSHCFRAADPKVQLVRADLLLIGVIFSGDIDTDISFGYGLFSPWCRLSDVADIKSLDLKIDLRMQHLTGGRLFPDWEGTLARLRAAARDVIW